MKTKLRSIPALLSLVFFLGLPFFLGAHQAGAAGLCPDDSKFSNLCTLNQDDLQNVPGQIVSILLIIAIILALIYLVYGGIKWITSGGDKQKVDGARSHITAAIVGLILALLAYFILNIITYIFTGQTFSSFTIPKLFNN